jgi:hypothetical protein
MLLAGLGQVVLGHGHNALLDFRPAAAVGPPRLQGSRRRPALGGPGTNTTRACCPTQPVGPHAQPQPRPRRQRGLGGAWPHQGADSLERLAAGEAPLGEHGKAEVAAVPGDGRARGDERRSAGEGHRGALCKHPGGPPHRKVHFVLVPQRACEQKGVCREQSWVARRSEDGDARTAAACFALQQEGGGRRQPPLLIVRQRSQRHAHWLARSEMSCPSTVVYLQCQWRKDRFRYCTFVFSPVPLQFVGQWSEGRGAAGAAGEPGHGMPDWHTRGKYTKQVLRSVCVGQPRERQAHCGGAASLPALRLLTCSRQAGHSSAKRYRCCHLRCVLPGGTRGSSPRRMERRPTLEAQYHPAGGGMRGKATVLNVLGRGGVGVMVCVPGGGGPLPAHKTPCSGCRLPKGNDPGTTGEHPPPPPTLPRFFLPRHFRFLV